MFTNFKQVLAVSESIRKVLEDIVASNSPSGETHCIIPKVGAESPQQYTDENVIAVRYRTVRNGGVFGHAILSAVSEKHVLDQSLVISIDFIHANTIAMGMNRFQPAQMNPAMQTGSMELLTGNQLQRPQELSPAHINLVTIERNNREQFPIPTIIAEFKNAIVGRQFKQVLFARLLHRNTPTFDISRFSTRVQWLSINTMSDGFSVSAVGAPELEKCVEFKHVYREPILPNDYVELMEMYVTKAFTAGLIANPQHHEIPMNVLVNGDPEWRD